MLKLLILMLCTAYAQQPRCNERTALMQLRRPTYDFALKILDRVAQETKHANFVFSPLSTWLQLLALSDGAQGSTLNEILNVTRYHRMVCFRKHVRDIFNSLDENLTGFGNRSNIIVIDKLLDVKDSYRTDVEKLNAAKVLSLSFRDGERSAAEVNRIIEIDTNGVIKEAVVAQDFNMSVLLMSDISYMKADWRYPFNPVYTQREPFFSDEEIPTGQVNMMYQTGYFNTTNVPFINAKALELPFNDRLTMIFLSPIKGKAADLFLSMKKIRLMTIFSLMKRNGPRLINVKMPRFKVNTDIDNIPELLYDMGLHRMFYPHLANLRNMSDYRVFVSMMTSVTDIEVTETGVTASIGPETLIRPHTATDFHLNHPFAYLIVDKTTDAILYAGVYTTPSLY